MSKESAAGRLRVGVVGAGGIAQMMHLPTLAERPDLFEIVGLADLRQDVASAAGRRYGVACCVTDYRELFAKKEVDAVLLLASGSQREAVESALEAGKHVFVEKPLGFGSSEVEAIAARARRSPELVVMVGYHKRYDPVFRRARDIVHTLRDLRYVDVTVLHPDDSAYRAHHAILPLPDGQPRSAPSEQDERRGVAEWVTSGPLAAALGEIAGSSPARRVMALLASQSLVHDINLVRSVLGEPEGIASAHFWQGGWAQSSVVRFPKGVRVNMSWISLPGLKHYEETLRFVSPEARVTLTFPSPYLRHLPTSLHVERSDSDGGLVVEHHTPSHESAFRDEIHVFRRAVMGGPRPETSVDDAVGDARFIDQLVRAATE